MSINVRTNFNIRLTQFSNAPRPKSWAVHEVLALYLSANRFDGLDPIFPRRYPRYLAVLVYPYTFGKSDNLNKNSERVGLVEVAD